MLSRSLMLVATTLFIMVLATGVAQLNQVVVIEYGESLCKACAEQKRTLEQLQSEGVIRFLYVELMENQSNVREFTSLYDNLNLRDVEGGYFVPTLAIVLDGEVRGVVVGLCNASRLKQIVDQASRSRGLRVWSSKGVFEVTNDTVVSSVQSIVDNRLKGSGLALPERGMSLTEVVALLIPLAAADSVNPCTFAVYTALLMMILVLGGARKMVLSAAAFLASVFACYYLLGTGLILITANLPSYFIKVLSAVGLTVGVYSIASNLKGGFKSPVPQKLKAITEDTLNRVTGPLGAAGLGAICSFTLLPCSSGPYIVFAGVLSRLQDPLQRYLLLAAYNFIFVSPLAVLAIAVTLLSIKAKSLKKMRSEKTLKTMEIVASSLLAAVCLWLLIAY
ncbi:MAG: hypothetical protein NZ954_05715 [Thermofilaceae archaeon]|nr:hypothetical protein [Thermofilaceae archaeon]MCX8179891.1 hypothetical protein [Thermofilaceae archaeon]MDW8004424.1 hypothetical protein [Thermofilaceae archaeon]